MFSSLPTGKAPIFLRLNRRFRLALFVAFSALFVTGAVWLWANAMKDTEGGEWYQAAAANLLMLHGGAAMLTLMLLGALVPLHIQRAWRSNRNKVSGIAMVVVNAILIFTAFELYYSGSDSVRPWVSNLHVAFGLSLPLLLVVHILRGQMSRPIK